MTRWLVARRWRRSSPCSPGYLALPEPGAGDRAPDAGVGRSTAPLAGALLVAFAAGALAGRARRRRRGRARVAGALARRPARSARGEARAGGRARARARLGRRLRAGARRARCAPRAARPPDAAARRAPRRDLPARGRPRRRARRVLEDGARPGSGSTRVSSTCSPTSPSAPGDLRGAAEALERARAGAARRARASRAGCATCTPPPSAGRRRSRCRASSSSACATPASLAAEERVLRGLRYQAALADSRAAARACAARRAHARGPDFVPAWVERRATSSSGTGGASPRGACGSVACAASRPRVLLERLERLNASDGRPERTTRAPTAACSVAIRTPAALLAPPRAPSDRSAARSTRRPRCSSALPAPARRPPARARALGRAAPPPRRPPHRRRHVRPRLRAGPRRPHAVPLPRVPAGDATSWSGYCAECRRWGTYGSRGGAREHGPV